MSAYERNGSVDHPAAPAAHKYAGYGLHSRQNTKALKTSAMILGV